MTITTDKVGIEPTYTFTGDSATNERSLYEGKKPTKAKQLKLNYSNSTSNMS